MVRLVALLSCAAAPAAVLAAVPPSAFLRGHAEVRMCALKKKYKKHATLGCVSCMTGKYCTVVLALLPFVACFSASGMRSVPLGAKQAAVLGAPVCANRALFCVVVAPVCVGAHARCFRVQQQYLFLIRDPCSVFFFFFFGLVFFFVLSVCVCVCVANRFTGRIIPTWSYCYYRCTTYTYSTGALFVNVFVSPNPMRPYSLSCFSLMLCRARLFLSRSTTPPASSNQAWRAPVTSTWDALPTAGATACSATS